MKISKVVIFLFLLINTVIVSGQSKTIASWAENKEGLRKLCFYPTTLRMVNIAKEESFNNMIKDIEKLKVIITEDKTVVTRNEIAALKKGINAEHYNDMVQFKQGKESVYVYLKEKNNKPVGFAGIIYSENKFILIDLEGYISPDVLQQIIQGKMNFGALSKIYDIAKPQKNNESKPKK